MVGKRTVAGETSSDLLKPVETRSHLRHSLNGTLL